MNHKCPHYTVVCPEQITPCAWHFCGFAENWEQNWIFFFRREHTFGTICCSICLSLTSGNEVNSAWAVCFSQHFSLLSVPALYSLLALVKTNWNEKLTHTQNPICVWWWNLFLIPAHCCFLQINVCLISWMYDTITKFPVSSSHVTTGRQMLRIHLIQASGYTDTFSCNSWRKKCFLAI